MAKVFDGGAIPRKIVSGPGVVAEIGQHINDLGVHRILLLTSPTVHSKSGFVERVKDAVGSKIVGVFSQVEPHSPVRSLQAATSVAKELGADAVFSLGGGAVHDTSKAVALMATTGRDIRDLASRFEPPDKFVAPTVNAEPLPVITMPSTFSAADVVGGGAFTDTESGVKSIFVHPMLTPRLVVLDGELAATTPLSVLLPSSMNALHHNVEAICSKGNQSITDAFAVHSLRLLGAAVPALATTSEGERVPVAQQLLEAAALSGLTYGNSWLGVGHAICHSLGGRFALSHAEANAVIMPHAMRFNLPKAATRLALVASGLGLTTRGQDDVSSAQAAIAFVDDLAAKLGLPRKLHDLGLAEGSEDAIADDVMNDPQTFWNPRRVTREDVKAIIRAAYA